MVSVDRHAVAGGADHPERHQSAAIRDAEGHHRGEEKRGSQGADAGGHSAAAGDRVALAANEEQTDPHDRRIAWRSGERTDSTTEGGGAGPVILVIAEQRDGKLVRATWEALAASQQLAGDSPIKVIVLGASVGETPAELATGGVSEVLVVEHPALSPYTPDAFTMALSSVIGAVAPTFVMLPHTYQTRDFAPLLAARLRKALITDVTGIAGTGTSARFTRPMFQGKLAADVRPRGEGPFFITVQIGAFRAD